jgi:hypothetical protein
LFERSSSPFGLAERIGLVERFRAYSKMADEFQIQTRGMDVEVALCSSTVVRGRVFLHSATERHGGSEKVEDVLNRKETFFPLAVRENGDRTLLINKQQVLFVKIPATPSKGYIAERTIKSWAVQVSIEMVQGAPLQGVVHFTQPPGRDRTLDGLNEAQGFLCLVQESAFLYVNLLHVVLMRERGPQFESIPPAAP